MAAELPKTPTEPEPASAAPEASPPALENRHTRRANAVIKRKPTHKEVVEEIQAPDPFQQQGRTVVDWVVDHVKQLGLALGVVLVGLLGWGILEGVSRGSRGEAAEALFVARKDLPLGSSLEDGAKDDEAALALALTALEAVVAGHAGTPQANEARVDAAGVAYRLGQYDKALSLYQIAAKDDGLVGTVALAGVASTLESQGKLPEAAAGLEALRARAKGGTRAQATLDLARVHASAGDIDKARGLLVAFEEEFPDSLLLPDAQARLAALQ